MSLDLLGIFAAGLLTFASPCILPLVPIYLALLGGASVDELAEGGGAWRTVRSAFAFVLGLSVVFVGLGMAATLVGRSLLAHRALLLQLGGLAVFLFGLKLAGLLQIPWLEREYRPLVKRGGGGLLSGFVLGATFGLGWTPCIGPVLGSVLTYTASTTTSPASGALHLGAYALGLSLPLLVVAAIAPLALRWLKRLHKHMSAMQRATGALLMLIGLLLITDKLGAIAPSSFTAGSTRPEVAQAAAPASKDGAACSASAPGGEAACSLPQSEVAGSRQAMPQGPAMVELISGTCPVCLRMAPVVAAAERDCAGRKVQVERIRVDLPGGRELARHFGVLGVPTFVFIDEDGAEVARLVGEQSLATLEQTLQVLTGEQCDGFRAFPGGPHQSTPAPKTDAGGATGPTADRG